MNWTSRASVAGSSWSSPFAASFTATARYKGGDRKREREDAAGAIRVGHAAELASVRVDDSAADRQPPPRQIQPCATNWPRTNAPRRCSTCAISTRRSTTASTSPSSTPSAASWLDLPALARGASGATACHTGLRVFPCDGACASDYGGASSVRRRRDEGVGEPPRRHFRLTAWRALRLGGSEDETADGGIASWRASIGMSYATRNASGENRGPHPGSHLRCRWRTGGGRHRPVRPVIAMSQWTVLLERCLLAVRDVSAGWIPDRRMLRDLEYGVYAVLDLSAG